MGPVRRTNQDRYGIRSFPDGTVVMGLADGLGGEPGGEIAARHVMESLENWPGPEGKNTTASLMDFFIRMDREIVAMAAKKEALSGMATTLILVAVKGEQAVFAHSGDSRLYHYRAGNLRQVTQDQTLARFLMVEGEISGDEARTHYSRNVPDQCLGCRDPVPETGEIRLETGEILVLMSDGVHGVVEKETMAEVLNKADTCDHAADHLIGLALAAGGKDNMTVVLGKFR
jgi:protein phosphatase